MAEPANATQSSTSRLTSWLFLPAVAITNRLTYARKFVLIGLVLLAPLAFLLRLQYVGSSESIDFNAKERLGIEHIDPTKDFLYALEKRRVLVAAEFAGGVMKDELTTVTAEADARLSAVSAVDQRYGGADQLKTSEKWGRIVTGWNALKGKTFANAIDADAAHAELGALLVDLILNHSCNYSNLILDPDLDSYWLMDAWCTKMPIISESISGTATRALRSLSARTDEQMIDLAGETRVLTATTNDLAAVNMKTAFAETKDPKNGQSPTLEPNLTLPSQGVTLKVGAYADLLKNGFLLRAKAAPTADPAALRSVVDSALAALAASNLLYDRIAPELDWLCAKRVINYSGRRMLGLGLGVLAVVLVGYFFAGFYLSVRASVVSLGGATRRMIEGSEESFQLEAKDELGQIADSYNQINEALIKSRTLQRQVEKDNLELQENIMDLLRVVSDASDGDLRVRAQNHGRRARQRGRRVQSPARVATGLG
ncbi:MAG: hypothetical protein QM756_08930 [Polyangiaceae bacterium]